MVRPGLEGALTYGVEQVLSKSSKVGGGCGFGGWRSSIIVVKVKEKEEE